jgi:peptidoglycan/xylan/chitin deacetylase (PgdA/CDA1 family)
MKFLPVFLAVVVAAAAGQAAAQNPVPVLTYHRFDPEIAKASTVVTTPVFEQQIAWLVAHHFHIAPLRDVVASELGTGPAVPGPAVAITADDGFRSVYTEMFPIIRRERMPVTLFINPPMISGGGAYLTWGMIEEMRQSGLVDVQAHTQTHPNFNTERAKLGPQAYEAFITEEIAGSRRAIQTRLGTPPDMLAWPFGIHDAQLEDAAKQAGFSVAFALGSRASTAGGDVFAIPRFQVYNSDVGGRFAAVAEGHPRGKGLQAAAQSPIASSTPRSAVQSP